MHFRKPTSWAGAALLIVMLAFAAAFGTTGWSESGIGAGDISIVGAVALVCGVVAAVGLCIGLLTIAFEQHRQSRRPTVSPPSLATPRRPSGPRA